MDQRDENNLHLNGHHVRITSPSLPGGPHRRRHLGNHAKLVINVKMGQDGFAVNRLSQVIGGT